MKSLFYWKSSISLHPLLKKSTFPERVIWQDWLKRHDLWGSKKVGKNFEKSLVEKVEYSIFVVPCLQKKGWEKVLWINDEVVAHRRERSRQKPSDFDWVFEETGLIFKGYLRNKYYNEEFDPGSGWTLAGGLTHASRGAAWGSNTLMATGRRVSNAYVTYPVQGDNPEKFGLISHNNIRRHLWIFKVPAVRDGHA